MRTLSRHALKWRVPVDGHTHEVELPHGARILATSAQTPYAVEFWTETLVGEPQRDRRSFQIFATGEAIPTGFNHVSTAMHDNGRLVWHLYEYSGGQDRRHTEGALARSRHLIEGVEPGRSLV